MPCLVAFLLVPDLIMRALFARGAFTAADARRAGATLAAYAIGLLPFVLMRSVTVTFLARGDTADAGEGAVLSRSRSTSRSRSLLMGSYAQVGLAFATSIGAWINLALLLWFAARRDLIAIDERLKAAAGKLALAGLALAVALLLRRARRPRLACRMAGVARRGRAGAARGARRASSTSAIVLALFGRQWLAAFAPRKAPTPPSEPD